VLQLQFVGGRTKQPVKYSLRGLLHGAFAATR
jgi:hypothetical protein